MIQIDQQKIVPVQRSSFGSDVRRFKGDPFHFFEMFIQDHPFARSITEQTVIVVGACLIVIAVIGFAFHFVFLKIPPAGMAARFGFCFML